MEDFSYHPVTPDRWPDLEGLFSAAGETGQGSPARCWCMEIRRPLDEWRAQQGGGNRRAMKMLVESGQVPGILAYADGEPVAWCSIAPRPQFVGLKEIGQFRRFDNPDVWTVSCFYVRDDFQGHGLMEKLLRAAVERATAHGAKVVEGYPVDPQSPEEREQWVSRAWPRSSGRSAS